MHAKATFVFWTTLILYIITLCSVTYVGVYLTYVTIPLIVLSGLIMKCTKPKPEHKEIIDKTKSALKETGKAAKSTLNTFNSLLDEVNNSLDEFNQITKLGMERTEHLRAQIHQLKLQRLPIDSKYDDIQDMNKTWENREKRNDIDSKLREIEKNIATIKEACELEVKSRKAVS